MKTSWKSDLIWGALAASVVGYEVHTIHNAKLDHTLTRTVRRYFRTKHPVGKAAFAVGWGWFAVWFLRHVLETGDDQIWRYIMKRLGPSEN